MASLQEGNQSSVLGYTHEQCFANCLGSFFFNFKSIRTNIFDPHPVQQYESTDHVLGYCSNAKLL